MNFTIRLFVQLCVQYSVGDFDEFVNTYFWMIDDIAPIMITVIQYYFIYEMRMIHVFLKSDNS